MSTTRAEVEMPSDAEDAAIRLGMESDPDNPEWTSADFKAARPAAEMIPSSVYAELKRGRGPGKTLPKVVISLRVSPDLAERWRATGPGWQARAAALLAEPFTGTK